MIIIIMKTILPCEVDCSGGDVDVHQPGYNSGLKGAWWSDHQDDGDRMEDQNNDHDYVEHDVDVDNCTFMAMHNQLLSSIDNLNTI